MTTVYLDFETRSTIDLKRSGLHVYASDPTTEILCVGWAVDFEPAKVCIPKDITPEHEFNKVLAEIKRGQTVVAHNASFELAIFNSVGRRLGWPNIQTSQTICTMAMSYAMSLPGSLKDAAAAVGLEHQKDSSGGRIMLQLSQPRDVVDGKIIWWDDAEKLNRVMEYCKTDVEVERELYKRLKQLSSEEKELWEFDQIINNRGVAVDLKAVKNAIKLVDLERERLHSKMREITGNQVATCNSTGQMISWLKTFGLEIPSIAKADVTEMLGRKDLPDKVIEALQIRQEAAKSSTAKLNSILEGVGEDGRVRGLFQYHGAGTGRWAGRRVQLQNLPRPKIKQEEIETVLKIIGEIQ
jgi:DNA polymerase